MEKKKIILCDSNIIFNYFRGNEQVTSELDRLGFARLAVSTITIAETYYGMKKSEARQTKELLNKFNTYHLTKNISLIFLDILFTYRSQIEIPDALIAATALENNVALYTQNIQDFDFIKGLQLYQPK